MYVWLDEKKGSCEVHVSCCYMDSMKTLYDNDSSLHEIKG
jgi:hypothetical protein